MDKNGDFGKMTPSSIYGNRWDHKENILKWNYMCPSKAVV